MKKIYILLILAFLIVLTGCTKEEKQNGIRNYAVQMNFINEQQEIIAKIYESQVVSEKDLEKARKVLKEKVYLEYEEILKEVEEVKVKDKKIEEIHGSYVKAVALRLKTYENYIKALEEGNNELLKKTEKENLEIKKLFAKHEKELVLYAQEFDIEIKISK